MNREDVAMNLTFENLDILRKEVQAAKLLLSECDKVLEEDGGVYIELRAFLSGKMDADEVIELLDPPAEQRNQCDGCQAGIPLVDGAHSMGRPGGYPDLMSCQKERYKHPEQAEGAQGEREVCAECSGSGKVYDVSGDGPWSCYACTDSPEVIGYANGDELDNMLDDRTAILSPVKTGFHTVPVYRQARAALAQPSPVPVGNIELARKLFEEMALIADDEKCIHMLAGALAQPSPAPELERPEVAAWVQPISGMNEFFRTEAEANAERAQYLSSFEPEPEDLELKPEALIRLADFDRIVGALRADIGFRIGMAIAKKESEFRDFVDEHWRPIAAQRDAAQARVAELEKQEPVAWALQRKSDGFVRATWNQKPSETQYEIAELDGDVIAPLYAATVAQAGQLHELDKQCRDDVARALGLTPQGDGYAWSALLADIKTAAKVAQAGQVPSVCDGKEQDAFEAWATGQKMDISCHPLHWLFLNEKTYSARQGWKAALEYVGSQIAAAPAQEGE